MFKRLVPLCLILSLLFWPVLPAAAGDVDRGASTVKEIMDYVHRYHIGKPEVGQLVDGAVRGMLENLGDPYTEYLSPEGLDQFTGSLEGEMAGIGVELEGWPPYPAVVKVMPGSPAARAGIREKDRIIRVDGQEVGGLPLQQVVEKIRGPAGSRVVLTIRRSGGQDLTVEVNRENLNLPTLEWQMLPGNTGYINIRTFGSRTAEELKAVLEKWQPAGISGLILDLRSDPGGYLQAAVDIAGYFLPAGQLVVTTVDRDGRKENYYTAGRAMAAGIPLVVLVDGMTASAAEVLAGALQDYKAAVLVGDRTYGKGVVQAIIPLEAGGALKITVARYLTPRGRSIDGSGLAPDRWVLTPALQLPAARQELHPGAPRTVIFDLKGGAVMVGGEECPGGLPAQVRSGDVYLPLRFTLEALGFQVRWQEEGRLVFIDAPGRKAVLHVDRNTVTINGLEQPLGGTLYSPAGSLYAPLSLFTTLGVTVSPPEEHLKLELSPGKQE
ncbi:MAG TPA: PDZ domain-containing protein [Desulfotomaculum sp.]|nr:PDZ domain-containing protein [Desulfotomaculum sp.]